MDELREPLLLAAGFVLSIIAALIGAGMQRALDRRAEMRPLNQFLNFGRDELLFVFPHRDEVPGAILPRTSTEDFLAMNNFISALINLGWSRKIGVRDTGKIQPRDKGKNLVIICSPKSNTICEEFQNIINPRVRRYFWFEPSTKPASQTGQVEWLIKDGTSITESPSYDQERHYLIEKNLPRHELASQAFEDFAVITKVNNPWIEGSRNKVFVIAGIRGIGTWGAAECIKKEWKQIYEKLPVMGKEADFSALVRINYENLDITKITVERVIPL